MSIAGSSTPAVVAAPSLADRSRIGLVVDLTKARLNGMVVLTTAVGFVVASPLAAQWTTLLATMVGTALAAFSASVLNQVIEIDRDRRMHRTADRPLPAGAISSRAATAIGLLLGVAGVAVLATLANVLAATLALVTILIYVAIYTPLKTRTTLNTLAGAVCGALPPMIGWAAATGAIGPGAWLLASLMFVWQLPHFFALAWLYRDDYARGGFVMLPFRDPGGRLTAPVSLAATLVLVMIGLMAVLSGVAGLLFGATATVAALWMAGCCLSFCNERTDERARRIFHASLVYLALAMALLLVDAGPAFTVGT